MEKLIKKHLKAEVMNTPEFREIETMVSYEKLVRIKNDEQRKRMMERDPLILRKSMHEDC